MDNGKEKIIELITQALEEYPFYEARWHNLFENDKTTVPSGATLTITMSRKDLEPLFEEPE